MIRFRSSFAILYLILLMSLLEIILKQILYIMLFSNKIEKINWKEGGEHLC